MKQIVLSLTAVVLFYANTASAIDLKKIDSMDPLNEAQKAASGDSVFFVGIYGYSLILPGVPGNPYCWEGSGLVKVAPNTSDALLTNEDVRWQQVAGRFSKAFNTKLLELVPELVTHECAHNN